MSKADKSGSTGERAPAEKPSLASASTDAIFAAIIGRALRDDDALTAAARIQIAQLGTAQRDRMLERLLIEMQPADVDPNLWFEWLDGAPPPSRRSDLENPVAGTHSGSEVAKRRSAARLKAEQRIATARAELAAAEASLDKLKSVEAELSTWAVMTRLIAIVSPIFAMGPAWTMMRAISANARGSKGSAKQRGETDALLKMLHRWRGDGNFESDVRASLLKLSSSYPGEDDDETESPRGRGKVRTESETAEVLDGLTKQTPPVPAPAKARDPNDPSDSGTL